MTNPPDHNNAKAPPGDDEIAAILERSRSRKPARDPTAPSPRMPEALYFYIFILVEAVLLMGVWGFMRIDADAVMGPGLDNPDVGQWISFNLRSMLDGVAELIVSMPWVPALVMLAALVVFLPATPKQRRRAASLISMLIVAVFVLMIAVQFSEDMSRLTRT